MAHSIPIPQRDPFSQRAVIARYLSGMTQSDVAAKMGVSLVNVANWEGGRSRPRTGRLAVFAAALGCPVGWLLGETDTLVLGRYTLTISPNEPTA